MAIISLKMAIELRFIYGQLLPVIGFSYDEGRLRGIAMKQKLLMDEMDSLDTELIMMGIENEVEGIEKIIGVFSEREKEQG